MTAIDRDQTLDALKEKQVELQELADRRLEVGDDQYASVAARIRLVIKLRELVAALPAIPLDRDPIEIVQQQAEEDFVEWYERTTKPAPMWAEQAREWAHWLGGEDGGDLAELIGVHFFGELPRALPVLETKKETE